MKLGVLVKQVPATHHVKIDEATGTMVRDAMESELNPLDTYAVEEAVRIKENLRKADNSPEITVLSMGPPQAVEAIREAISMGCDKGYLLSDRRFAGADTWATAHTLTLAIRHLGGFDLILAGERATDGETGQVGPSIAAQLGIPVLTYVKKIEKLNSRTVQVHRSVEGGTEVLESSLPALITVVKEINEPRIPNFKGKMRARKTEIPTLSAADLNADPKETGLTGSPTRVVKVFSPKLSRTCEIIDGTDPSKAAESLIGFLVGKGFLQETLHEAT